MDLTRRVAIARARACSVLLRGESSLSDWEYIEAVLNSHRPPLVGPLGGYPEFPSIYERGESSRTSDADKDRRVSSPRGRAGCPSARDIHRDDQPPMRGPTAEKRPCQPSPVAASVPVAAINNSDTVGTSSGTLPKSLSKSLNSGATSKSLGIASLSKP